MTTDRGVVIEAPVSFEINGLGYAVMMATPADLIDFGVGFAMSEGIVDGMADVVDVDAVEVSDGWILRITISDTCAAPVRERIRHRITDSGCGLCGVENLQQAMRSLPRLTTRSAASADAVFAALAALQAHQPLNAATGAAHAAALCDDDGAILLCREDVGRHNAFDKLIGAARRAGTRFDTGFVLLSSRCSYELVEKAVRAGTPMLVTISAPTTLAVDRARDAGLTLVALARSDALLVLNDPFALFASTR
ncbi:MAG: formate dehydrogenase accessory sulfurtransferase FdhD [Sphingomonadaceae bacterium]|nr:formate dehydrogenase accessory sulfurtransferase FdhD [Sphingomonadaceae bacterium]